MLGYTWQCVTYSSKGKRYCPASQIPEETLIALTCQVLDVEELTEEAVEALSEIRVTGKGCLRFVLRDGRVEERQWAWESRADSWSFFGVHSIIAFLFLPAWLMSSLIVAFFPKRGKRD